MTGTLIGSLAPRGGDLSFGAPGLHGAGARGGEETAAIAIGAAALLFALAGLGWEGRRREAAP